MLKKLQTEIFCFSLLLLSACGGGGGGSGSGGGASSFIVTPSSGANGAISPSVPKTVASGSAPSFTVTPATGYSASVTGCGGSLAGNIYTTGAISGDCTVSASFTPSQFTVTPSAGSNGSITPSVEQAVAYNGTTSFTITPSPTFSIVSVTGCGGSLSGTTYTTGPVTGNCTVSASFVLNQYPVTTRVSSGTGTIYCTPASPVTAGNAVNCSITPGTVYQLASLLDNSTNVTGSVSGAGTYSIPGIAAAHDLAATFSLKQYTVTPSAGANGSITPSSAQQVSHGAQPTFTITPNAGYYVASATGCGGTLSGSTYTTLPVTGYCTVSASYAHYTAGILSLSVATEPSKLGFLEIDIPIPTGVQTVNMTPGADPDVFDISASVNPAPLAATYKVSTKTIKLVFLNTSDGIGIASLVSVNLSVASTASVTAASFPSTATVISASDTGLNEITSPASTIAVPIGVVLQ